MGASEEDKPNFFYLNKKKKKLKILQCPHFEKKRKYLQFLIYYNDNFILAILL